MTKENMQKLALLTGRGKKGENELSKMAAQVEKFVQTGRWPKGKGSR